MLILNDIEKIDYYIYISIEHNLSVRELRKRIKSKEYERLDDSTKNKLINKKGSEVADFIKNPILISNCNNNEDISETTLKKLMMEDIDNFLIELGEGFSYLKSEYKINVGDRYNYIDLLLYNIKYKCYVVVELKVTELKKEHIGQIQIYMNYVDKNLKEIEGGTTIGIIICKKDNKFVMEYCSDSRVFTNSI